MTDSKSEYNRYFKDISNYPRISREREKILCEIISTGKKAEYVEAAVDELVRANLRLVVHCVKGFSSFTRSSNTSITMMDLIAEGNLALVKAAQNFNPKYQTDDHAQPIRFSGYACKCIKNAIRKAFRKARFIHIPDHHFGYWKQIKELNEQSENELSDSEIQSKLDIGESRLKTIKIGLKSNTMMLEDFTNDDESTHWSDFMADDRAECPHKETETTDLRDYLLNEMESLPPRTKDMLSMMFLSDNRPTLQDMSVRFGVSKERCRQVCARGLQLMRNKMQTTWDHIEDVEIFASSKITDKPAEEINFFASKQQLSVA